jgi:DNA-binding NtrC family response regulator
VNETGEFSTLLRLEEPSEDAGAAFLLTVVDGPDEGSTLLVDASLPCRVYAGTSSWCEMRLTDDEVSRRQLALEAIGEKLRVTDLGSTPGTTADGVHLVEGFMRGGELLRLGRTKIRVERREALAGGRGSRAERFGRVVGASAEMQRLYPLCERLAAASVPLVIEGEAGTGKEVLAEALHEQGPRAQGPFIVFDCTAVPSALVDPSGFFQKAHQGTLLVDEVGDLEPTLQAKLLRELERQGADVRMLFATTRDLDRLVETGRFRQDLLERLSFARLELPPLRRRSGDVRRLALHFAREIGGPAATLPPDLVALWESDRWPGNVRALRKAVARWLALDDLAVEMTGAAVSGAAPSAPFIEEIIAQRVPFVQAREKVLAELERRYAERVLAENGGDAARAADASGIARRHFDRHRE